MSHLLLVLSLALGEISHQPADREKVEKLQREIAELKRQLAAKEAELAKLLPQPAEPENGVIVKLNDEPESFKGRSLTFLLIYSETRAMADTLGLKQQRTRGLTHFTFLGVDPKSKVKVSLSLYLPEGITTPNIRNGESAIIRFRCEKGSLTDGNTIEAIARPN